MIDVQKRPLSTLEQQVLALSDPIVEKRLGVGHERAKPIDPTPASRNDFLSCRNLPAERRDLAPEAIDLGLDATFPVRRHQVTHPDAETGDLVLVGWADTASGGANLGPTHGRFASPVQNRIQGKNHMGPFRNEEATLEVHISLDETIELAEQRVGVDHHSAAQNTECLGVEHTRWHQVQGKMSILELDGVASIVAALIAHHNIERGTEQIDDLSLSLVTPLHTVDDRVGHGLIPG